MRLRTASTTSSGETFFFAIAAARSTADIQQRASSAMPRVSSRDRGALPSETRAPTIEGLARGPLPGGGPGRRADRARETAPARPPGALDQSRVLGAEQRLQPAADL